MLNVIIALFLALFALLVILFIVKALLSPILNKTSRPNLARQFKKKLKYLEQADELIKEGKEAESYKLIYQAFYLDNKVTSLENVINAGNHNQSVLARVLVVADAAGLKFNNLPVIEELFSSRTQLQKTILELVSSRKNTLKERKARGSSTPNWAIDELKKKEQDTISRLQANHQALKKQIDELFDTLCSATPVKKDDPITYH